MVLTVRRILVILGVILLVGAAVIGYDWWAPDKAEDAEKWYRGLLAFGGAFGFAGLIS